MFVSLTCLEIVNKFNTDMGSVAEELAIVLLTHTMNMLVSEPVKRAKQGPYKWKNEWPRN